MNSPYLCHQCNCLEKQSSSRYRTCGGAAAGAVIMVSGPVMSTQLIIFGDNSACPHDVVMHVPISAHISAPCICTPEVC
eukprot:9502190-Pyramimonas_sp.AAC.1